MDKLDDFINDIINQKKLHGMTPEVRAQLVADLRESLLDQVNRALVDALPDDKIDEFIALMDNEDNGDDALERFIEANGVDIPAVTATTMVRFRDLYLESSGA